MTINLEKLNNNDVLIVETKNGNECYEITIIDNEEYLVEIYERLKSPTKQKYNLSNDLDIINGLIEKDKCIIFTIEGETKITDVVKGVTIISSKGFTLDVYPNVEREEKMRVSLEEAKARLLRNYNEDNS